MPRRRTRWVALVLALLAVSWGIYFLLTHTAELAPSVEASQWLLPALSLTLVVLVLGLAGVLIRNLVRLIIDRKRGILGSTLRIKLVFFFLALVLLPAMVLFSGSAQVIKQTVEAILRMPVESLTGGREIVDQWTDFFQVQSMRRARALAAEIRDGGYLAPSRRAELGELLRRRLEMESLQLIWVVQAGETTIRVEIPAVGTWDTERIDALVEKASVDGVAVAGINDFGDGLTAHAAVPIERTASAERRAVVAVGLGMPDRIAGSATSLDAAARAYRQFRTQRRDLVRFYVTLIGLVFVATLFVATWIGMYLARRITEPIQDVAAAAREISAGNLNVRVRARIGDEMGMLIEAFNEMAAELQENREVITRSTADLRRSNLALDERRRYIETLVANLSTAVVSLDPAGRVTTANPAVQKILGMAMPVGIEAAATLREHGMDELGDLLDQVRRTHLESVRRELELPARAPTSNVSVQISLLKGRSSETLGTLVMVEDLADLLRAQKALAWQEVARRIAHEIKNPLTPIQLAAQRLRKKSLAKSSDLDRVLLESTASIEREVAGLKQLVDEFSRYARMPEVTPKPVEFAKVVESVLTLYQGLTRIQWKVDLDPQVGLVRVDARQMRRALINLVDNAVAAVDGQGTIRITTRAAPQGGSVRIEVADSGPGIPPGDRDKMFVPYFSTKRRGTGLGLAIVHKVVTDHQGTIRIEDNQPRGARFVIEIPA